MINILILACVVGMLCILAAGDYAVKRFRQAKTERRLKELMK